MTLHTRRSLLASSLGLAALAACRHPPLMQPLHWQREPSGLEYARSEVPLGADRASVVIHLLRLDLHRHELRVVLAADLGKKLATAEEFRVQQKGLAAINAGYFDPEYRPLGLLVSGGRELAHLRLVDHGVFAIAGGRAQLDHARTFHAPPDLEFAIECGPRLLVAGERPRFRRADLARRVAIGHDSLGRVVLAVTEGVMGVEEFARVLALSEPVGGPGLRDALNLDGGSSAMLAAPLASGSVQVTTAVEVPVGLVVVSRNPL
jgi:uncharacterized protein YigE (DUF2233 family)